ncbi:MAG TPA: CAP domain-containing protein [Myxococcales bacterium]|nr:CAP domain-containing protein [Myxococcales bacterium]
MTPRGRVPFSAAPVAAALLLAAGCGANLSANRRSPGVVENGTFKPAKAPVAAYGQDPSLTCPERGVNGLVQDGVGTAAQPDGRLCAVAETLLGWGDDSPPDSVVSVIANDFGLPQPIRRITLQNADTKERTSSGTDTPGASVQEFADRLIPPIKSFAATAQNARYGLVTQRIRQGQTRFALLLQDQTIEIQPPFPRKLNPGQSATLSGSVLGKLKNPKVQYSDAVGHLEQPKGTPGKTFSTEIKCGDRPGKILVQVTAESEEGGEVPVANFAVGCGTELPVAARIPAAGGEAAVTDPPAAEKQIGELINQDRTQAGLQPLQVDPDLSKIARSISEDRAKGKNTSSAELNQRLRDAEISAPQLYESLAQTTGAEQAFQLMSSNPQDRSNAMNPNVTQVGIGVAPGAVINDKKTIIVTELFMKQLPPPDPVAIKAKLYEAIEQRRSDARAGAATKDPELEKIAQEYASEMAKDKGQVPRARVSEIEAPLYRGFSKVDEIGGVKADPMEFAQEPGVVGDAKLVGVGTAVGVSPNFGKNSTYVIILMGKKHEAKAPTKKPATRKPKKK